MLTQQSVAISATETLDVSWGPNWSDFAIHKDGELVTSVENRAALVIGKKFSLPDGREFNVSITDNGLEIWHAGKELVQGIKRDTSDGFATAYKALVFVAIIQFVLAIASVAFDERRGLFNAVFLVFPGIVFLGLGMWARRSGLNTPFWVGIVFCWIIILLRVLMGSFGGIFVPAIMLYFLYRGTQSEPKGIFRKNLDADLPLDSNL